MTEEKTDIDIIPGHTNIFLIAPHGVETKPFDDENTALLTQKIADRLKCHRFINRTYRKPNGPEGESEKDKKKRNNGDPDESKGVLDLNKITQAELHPTFLKEIKAGVDAEVLTYVFWIHGIDDDNIEKIGNDIQCLLGYGQPNTKTKPKQKPRLTAEQKTIDTVLKEFEKNGIKTIPAPETSKYRGWKKTYMNQWFLLHGYTHNQVQSIQLEFKKTGCRRPEDLEATAKKIADAISVLIPPAEKNIEPADKKEQPDDKAQVLEKITDPEEIKGAIEVGKSVSPIEQDEKVEEAYEHIRNIFVEKLQETMLAIGKYLINHFYDGKYEDAENKPFSHNKSLNRLFKKLQENAFGNAPKKTWLYDAINLAIGENKFNEVSAYGKLGHSHKIRLLNQKKLSHETKIQLMEQTVKDNLTVTELQKKIKEQKSGETIELNETIPAEHLMKLDTKKLQSLKNRTKNLEKKIKADLAIYQGNLEKIEKALQCMALPEKQPSTSKREKSDKNPIGFQEWTKKENTVNICTGCANDCKYCYAKSMAYRFGQVQEGQWMNQIIRDSDVNKKRKLYDGRVGFPTSHDITPQNVDAYLKVLKKLLEAGNEVLIVSKPSLDCIKKICETGSQYKDKILFRFTIGAMNNEILRFWDTNAPLYEERRNSLKHAFDSGFQTSVSMEPLLDSANVVTMATELEPYVTDAIWIGKMNHTSRLKIRPENQNDPALIEQIENLEKGQTDDKIKIIFADFQKKPELLKKIKWKDSFKKVLGIEKPTKAGMDI